MRGGEKTSCGTAESCDRLLAEAGGVRQQNGVRQQTLTRQQDYTGCWEDLTSCGVGLSESHEVAVTIVFSYNTNGGQWYGLGVCIVGSDLGSMWLHIHH